MIDLEAIRARVNAFRDNSNAVDDCGLYRAEDREELMDYVDALRAAAGKVTCTRCSGKGYIVEWPLHKRTLEMPDAIRKPCGDCNDLRTILQGSPQSGQ